jgi:hypothetical protein
MFRNLIIRNRLPQDFDFYAYQRKCLQHTILSIIELNEKVWLVIELLVIVAGVYSLIIGRYSETHCSY